MNEEQDTYIEYLKELADLSKQTVDKVVQGLSGKQVPVKFTENISNFNKRLEAFLEAIKNNSDLIKVEKSAQQITIYINAIFNSIKNLEISEETHAARAKLPELATKLNNSINGRLVTLDNEELASQNSKLSERESLSPKDLRNSISNIEQQLKTSEERQERRLEVVTKKLIEAESSLENLEMEYSAKLEKIDGLYDTTISSLKDKQKSVDSLLGTISASVIAGDYDENAAKEKKSADNLRVASLVCMFVIALVLGYSIYETNLESFSWEKAIFRLTFTLLLSVPAAYLAKESAKHRQFQNAHLQTSLDLKAITPYIASLPDDVQHNLKADIANRLFVPKNEIKRETDIYPVNINELLVKLIEKVELKNKGG